MKTNKKIVAAIFAAALALALMLSVNQLSRRINRSGV